MQAGWTLSTAARLALAIIGLGPVSVDDALAVWKYRCPTLDELDGHEAFISALRQLMGMGYMRVEPRGLLAITIAGRAALAIG